MPFGSFLKTKSRFANLYLKLLGIPYVYARLTAPFVLNSLPRNHGMVLDVGCGVGLYSLTLAKMGNEVVAADFSVQKLKLASTFQDRNKSDGCIHLVLCDVRKIPMRAKLFNCVLMLDIMEHISDDNAVVEEIGRVMTKGGTIIMTTPNSAPQVLKRWSAHMDEVRRKEHGHVRDGYTSSQISNILEKHGFFNLEVVEYFKILAVWAWKFHYRFWKVFGSVQFDELYSSTQGGFTVFIIALTFPFLFILCKLDSTLRDVGSELLVKATKL